MIQDYLKDDDEENTNSYMLQEEDDGYYYSQMHKKIKYSPESNVSKEQGSQSMDSRLYFLKTSRPDDQQLSFNSTSLLQNLLTVDQRDYPEYVI